MTTVSDIFRYPFQAMGSPCELRFVPPGTGDAGALARTLAEEVDRLESKYSRYLDDSVVSRINRLAGTGEAIVVDEETAGLLDYADTCCRHSDALFDITAGILRQLWDFRRDAGRDTLPDDESRAAVLARVGWHRVHWNNPHLTLPVPGMELDLGGLVKEYAADSTANLAADLGIAHGLVDLGGDIRVIGPRPEGSPWRIGIRHPRTPGAAVAEIDLAEGALATSGDYERYIEIDGRRYSHILDPLTGWPVPGLASVSVVAAQCLVAGTASTIAMLKGEAGPRWLDDLGLPNFRVDHAGEVSGTIMPRAPGRPDKQRW